MALSGRVVAGRVQEIIWFHGGAPSVGCVGHPRVSNGSLGLVDLPGRPVIALQELKMFFLLDCEKPRVPERFEEQDQDHYGNKEGEDEEHSEYGFLGAQGCGQVQ